jgi:hypothetical protein
VNISGLEYGETIANQIAELQSHGDIDEKAISEILFVSAPWPTYYNISESRFTHESQRFISHEFVTRVIEGWNSRQ